MLADTADITKYWEKRPFRTFKERFLSLGKESADAPAIRFWGDDKEQVITYKQLWTDITCFGTFLFHNGYNEKKRIVLVGGNSYKWIRIALTVLCTDNILLLLADTLPSEELLKQLCRIKADLVMYDDAQEEKLSSYEGAKINLNDKVLDRVKDTKAKDAFIKVTPNPDRTAYVIFTSGSSGIPKGVMLSERSAIAEILETPRVPCNIYIELLNMPLYHVLGFGYLLLISLCMGQSLYISSGIKSILEELRIVRPRRLMIMPLQLKLMLEMLEGKTPDEIMEILGGRLTVFASAGSPLPAFIKESFEKLGIFVSDGYGISEAGGGVTVDYKTLPKATGSAGVLYGIFEHRVDNPDSDGFGELYLKGPSIFEGYLDDPEETEKVLKDGWLKTGDIARVDHRGRVFVRGRADNLIVLSSGENVSPEPMEKKISEVQGVKECLIYEENDALTAEIYPEENSDHEEIKSSIRELNSTLRQHEFIYDIRFRDIPFEKTGTGKIIRAGRKDKAIGGPDRKLTISILTPIHEMPTELLVRAMNSVKRQDFVRCNIRWFIAVHNMDEQYLQQIRKIAEGTGFAEVFSVNESTGCLGAARNALLDKACGDYAFWLDGDDELTEGAVSGITAEMEKSRSDMAVFSVGEVTDEGARREYRSLSILPRLSPAVLEKGDPGIFDLINGITKDVYSWAYRSEFMKSSGVRFAEGEDSSLCDPCYVVKMAGKAGRISVLPRITGYTYHVRAGSDSAAKAGDALRYIGYLRRLWKELLAEQAETKADLSAFLWTTLSRAYMFMLRSRFTEQGYRQVLRDDMAGVLKEIRVLRKPHILSGDQIKELTDLMMFLCPEIGREFFIPKWKHRYYAGSIMTTRESVEGKLREVSAAFEGFRTVLDPANPFRGTVKEDAKPGLEVVDVRNKSADLQKRILLGYERTEELRDFGADESRLRVTLFNVAEGAFNVLVTWDEHYISEQAIDWMVDKCIK